MAMTQKKKFTVESEWSMGRTNFYKFFGNKAWTPITFAFYSKYQTAK